MTKILLLAPLMLLMMIGIAGATTPILPSGTQYYMNITVGSWASVHSTNVQQMLVINMSKYSTYFNTTPYNIRFTYPSGGNIHSWVEDNFSSTTKAMVVWVNITNTTTQIEMDMGAKTTNWFNNTWDGIAPQLTSTYAQYDDGAGVFPYYTNFAGTSVPSSMTTLGTGTTFNNGAIVAPSDFFETTSTVYNTQTQITDSYISSITYGTSGDEAGTAFVVSSSGGQYTVNSWLAASTGTGEFYSGINDYFSTTSDFTCSSVKDGAFTSSSTTSSSTGIWSLWATSTDSYCNINYGTPQTLTSDIPPSGSYYLMAGASSGASTVTYKWVRTRAYPPSGTMPSTSFGTVQQAPVVSLFISPNPATYGQSITITATCPTNTDTCAIDYPSLGTTIASGTGSATYTYDAFVLGAGTYSSFYAVDGTLGTSSPPQTLTINQNSTYTFTLTSCGAQIYPYTCTTTGTISTHNNQLGANLYLNTNLLGSTTTSISNTIANTLGYFPYTFNTLGNGNYISNSLTANFLLYVPIYATNVISTTTINTAYLSSPFTWNTYYPIKIYTQSPSSTLNYTLIQNINNAQSVLTANALNISYIPPANQLTGDYVYQIIERQAANSRNLEFTIAANTLNMTDMNSAINYSSLIQYFPILAHTPTWTAKPSSWYIESPSIVPQITQNTSAGAVFSTNVVGAFTPKIHLVYPFASFIMNYTDNPKVQNSITIQTFQLTLANSIIPSLRNIANMTIYDQETFNSIANANATFNTSITFNNYIFSRIFSNDTDTNGKYFLQTQKSNFQNPNITFQLNGTVSKPLFFAPSQFFCPSTVSYGSAAAYQIGLVDTNGTKYSFYVYTSTGSSAAGYILFINELQGVSARAAESLIIPPSLPMAVPLEQTGQEYQYIIYSANCKNTYYKGSFVDPTNPTYLTLATGPNQAVFYNTTNVTGACALNVSVDPYKLLCAASDSNAEVYQYKLEIFNSTNVLGQTSLVKVVYENSSSFSYNSTLPINQSYSYALYAYAFKKFDPTFLVNGGPLNIRQIQLSAPLLGIFAFILMLTLLFIGLNTGKVLIMLLLVDVGLLAVSMLNLAQIPTIATVLFIFIGAIISIWSIKAR